MKYKHYKNGKIYEVILVNVFDSSDAAPIDKSKMIVYRFGSEFYVRPMDEFFGKVDGVLRFTPVEE